jgi:hypothetical protein
MQRLSPFRLMQILFIGLAASLGYGVLSWAVILFLEGKSEAQAFLVAYAISFKTLISLGLIAGTALIVFRSQNVIPQIIEAAFPDDQLSVTDYPLYRRRYYNSKQSMLFSAKFIVAAFIIFSYSRFPLQGIAEVLMIVAVCIEYALGVYVGRKLCYAGMMLHSLLTTDSPPNLFRERKLDEINAYVHIVSTLTVIFVYVHVIGYYGGPFLYNSILGQSTKPLLILPAVIATPVLLIFNFYPRAVLRKLYGQSIDVEIKKLQETLQNENLSAYEKRSYVMEVDKMSRDELRYSLQLTLADLPIGITILIMMLEPLLR